MMIFNGLIAFFDRFMSTRYQVITILMTMGVILAMLHKPLTTFNTTDQKPKILPYIPKKQAVGSESAVDVLVGMYVQDFPSLILLRTTLLQILPSGLSLIQAYFPLRRFRNFRLSGELY